MSEAIKERQRSGSRRRGSLLRLFVLALLALVLAVVGCAKNKSATAPADQISCKPRQGATKIAAAKLLIEHNATDQDTGIQALFDDDGWTELCVYDPNGKQVMAVKPRAELKAQAMGELFFESREPPNSEVSVDEFLARFPEGKYEVRAVTFDGRGLKGFADFTHDIPAGAKITSPALAEDEEKAEQAPAIVTSGLQVAWEDVTQTLAGGPVTITGYEVIVTNEEKEDPDGFSQPTYDVHLPPDRNELAVPAEFLEPDTLYVVEVLALEKSGNQTISAGFFKTK